MFSCAEKWSLFFCFAHLFNVSSSLEVTVSLEQQKDILFEINKCEFLSCSEPPLDFFVACKGVQRPDHRYLKNIEKWLRNVGGLAMRLPVWWNIDIKRLGNSQEMSSTDIMVKSSNFCQSHNLAHVTLQSFWVQSRSQFYNLKSWNFLKNLRFYDQRFVTFITKTRNSTNVQILSEKVTHFCLC